MDASVICAGEPALTPGIASSDGDRLLRTAAAAWTATLRQTDLIARYGGEEFVVVMPDCTLEAAMLAGERLRAAVPAGSTCSAGVAEAEGLPSAVELIGRADQALYEAKAAGRNCTRAGSRAVLATGHEIG